MNLIRGLAVGSVLFCLVVVGVEAGGASKKTTSLIVGKWKMEKKDKAGDKEILTTVTAEFTKDGKLKVGIKVADIFNQDLEGTYKLIDDKTLETTMSKTDKDGKKDEKTEKMTIESLSKTKLVLSVKKKDENEKLEFDRVK